MVAPLIDLKDIRKSYGGGDSPAVEVLHGLSLTIHAGEFVALMGASGSGKSTLMHILGCLDRPTSGSYRFAGEDIGGFDADRLAWLRREAFGFVFQGYHLIRTLDALRNVEMPAVYAGVPSTGRRAGNGTSTTPWAAFATKNTCALICGISAPSALSTSKSTV